MAKRKLTEAGHQRLERMRVNAERTRTLAEKAPAELERRKQQQATQ